MILDRLSHPDSASVLRALVRQRRGAEYDGDGVAYFSERQTLDLMKLALLTIEADAPDGNPDNGALVEALLMISDHLDDGFKGLDWSTEDGRNAMELYVHANTAFNEAGHALHDHVRSHYLYVEQHDALSQLPGAVDVPARLARATGMPAAVAWRALFAFRAAWGRGPWRTSTRGASCRVDGSTSAPCRE